MLLSELVLFICQNKVLTFFDSYMTSYMHHVVIKVINLTTRLPPEGIVVALRPRVSIKQLHMMFAMSYGAEYRAK